MWNDIGNLTEHLLDSSTLIWIFHNDSVSVHMGATVRALPSNISTMVQNNSNFSSPCCQNIFSILEIINFKYVWNFKFQICLSWMSHYDMLNLNWSINQSIIILLYKSTCLLCLTRVGMVYIKVSYSPINMISQFNSVDTFHRKKYYAFLTQRPQSR